MIDPDEFLLRAFPEFPPSAPKDASLHGARGAELGGSTIEWYIAAYEATNRHHYEMQDEWQAIMTMADPDLLFYAGEHATTMLRQRFPPGLEGECPSPAWLDLEYLRDDVDMPVAAQARTTDCAGRGRPATIPISRLEG
jgi:hypothetical protein